ncbi:hypothetical protein Dimus_000677, partial [Dionaea muscipula]
MATVGEQAAVQESGGVLLFFSSSVVSDDGVGRRYTVMGWLVMSLGAQVLPLAMDGGRDGFKKMVAVVLLGVDKKQDVGLV